MRMRVVGVKEVVVQQERCQEDLLVSSKVGVVRNVQDISRVIMLLGEVAPLELYGLRHLKRVSKIVNTESPTGSEVLIYICPSSAIGDIPNDILTYFESPLRTQDVCKVKPRDRDERDAFGKFWPVLFRPAGCNAEDENLSSAETKGRMVSLLTFLHQLSLKYREENLALIVNPLNEKIVMDSIYARIILIERLAEGAASNCRQCDAADTIMSHPLYTPIMMCIEGVASLVRGDISCSDYRIHLDELSPKEDYAKFQAQSEYPAIKVCSSTPETDQYLCTGLEAYVLWEPTIMEAMALVHSRISRVIYLHSRPQCGALGSAVSLHNIASLNHHFRVVQGICEEFEDINENIPDCTRKKSL